MIRLFCMTFIIVFAMVVVAACMPQSEVDKINEINYRDEHFTVTKVCPRGAQYDRTVMRDPRNGDLYVHYRGQHTKASPGLTPDQICG